ncbi:MAG: bifunctional 2-polyprenyl-6-hydroxyphenol methylase/3-demethylubiquinol 3-O-methyltransferase UbiG [Burkholderiales bacterium]|nr:bifunctional 2-polyprenyl-6-hydroxyphenol methylase/3-demethylubiquinol 3-O-methyltransferase UbiG [Burkholderiales bacterium]
MNVDQIEIEKFSHNAHHWWDRNGEFKPLHDINPLRLGYVEKNAGILGKTVLDVGCGGGILAESMAAAGANVTGIDMAEKALNVAKLHLFESGQKVEYVKTPVEDFAQSRPGHYDVVTCMEMLEHVPDPQSIVSSCAKLVKPGGHVFFSTLNRNPKSYLYAVLGAEYMLNMLPRGTHDYAKFIKPSELAHFCRNAGLEIEDLVGMSYDPFEKKYSLGRNVDVNYILWCRA